MRASRIASILIVSLALVGGTTFGAQTLSWSETPESLRRGFADGVAVSYKGHLFAAPGLSRIGDESSSPGDSTHVWSIVFDERGAMFLGTGPDGNIVRITPTGRTELFHSLDEPMVTALAFAGDGDLLAATAPGGRIYRIDPAGNRELWAETDCRYVWALTMRDDGGVFAATGEDGGVVSVGPDGNSREFFDSDESHIVSLASSGDGSLLAGGAGSGLLYRIDPDGNATVIYDDELAEVAEIAIGRDGRVYAILLATPAPEIRRPAVRIQMPGTTPSGAGATGTAGSDAVAPPGEGTTIRGVIEGLPSPTDRRSSPQQGRLVRIENDGRAEVLWRSTSDAPFSLLRDSEGRILFGTGEPARVFRIEDEDDPALLVTLPEGQVTGLARLGRAVVVATSNPSGAYRLDETTDETGIFISRAFDAGGPARWGSIRWNVEGTASRTEIYTRTGNSASPDETWSAWSPALADPGGSAVVNPDGRYFQWRARFTAPRDRSTRLSNFTVYYEPYNRAPALREFYLDAPHRAISGDATFRWSAYDPDQDSVFVAVELSAAGTDTWSPLGGPGVSSGDDRVGELDWQEDRVVMKTDALDEGEYSLRVTIDDHAGNPPGEGHRIVARDDVRFIVDRSPPEIIVESAGDGRVEIRLVDSHSDIAALELITDGRTRFSLRPVDGLCDSGQEVFRVDTASLADPQGWTARGIDTAGNRVEAALTE